MDETGLYPPHVSVTGFFAATSQQAANICKAATESIAAQAEAGFHIEMRDVISTDSGYVLVDVFAPGVATFAVSLAAQAGTFGVHMRPKDVRHLSLASGRKPEEQSYIKQLCSILLQGPCTFDFVVAMLLHRSQDCNREAKPHIFRELLRLHLPGLTTIGANPLPWPHAGFLAAKQPNSRPMPPTLVATATPMKKRPFEWNPQDGNKGDSGEEEQTLQPLPPVTLEYEFTPTKICKKAGEPFKLAPILVTPRVKSKDVGNIIDSSGIQFAHTSGSRIPTPETEGDGIEEKIA